MTFKIDESYIFRHEYFGGFFHSRLGGGKYEVSHDVASFIHLMELGLSCSDSFDILTNMNFEKEKIINDLNLLLLQGVIKETCKSKKSLDSFGRRDIVRFLEEKLIEAKSRNHLRAPINLSIYPVMKCQLKCDFCFVTDEKWNIKNEVDFIKWCDVVSEAKNIGVPFISILGGEPTLYDDIIGLLSHIENVGIKTTFTTNGIHISSKLIDFLSESKWVTPVVSLQSLDDIHNTKTTGINSSKPLNTIAKLRGAGINCRVNSVYTHQTESQFEELMLLCSALGVEKFTIGHYLNIKGKGSSPTFTQSRSLYEKLRLIDVAGMDFQLEGCQLYTAYPELNRLPESNFEILVSGCEAGNGRGEIMSDGTFLPCGALDADRWKGKNVFENGLQRSWDESFTFEQIRNVRTKDKECKSCRFGYFCNGGCPAINERDFGLPFMLGDSRCGLKRLTNLVGIFPLR